jgi:hypothetical protein
MMIFQLIDELMKAFKCLFCVWKRMAIAVTPVASLEHKGLNTSWKILESNTTGWSMKAEHKYSNSAAE